MKNTQLLITEIETKIQQTQSLITNYRKELTNKENILQSFINQLQEIKLNMKATTNSPQDSKHIK